MSTMAPTALFRALLREAKRMDNYNFRSYAVRRVKAGFEKNRSLSGEEAGAAIKTGEEQLAVLHRQAILGQLYPSARSVME